MALVLTGVLAAASGSAAAATWTEQPVPNAPGPPDAALNAVSCASATDCTAVGRDSIGGTGLIEHFDGSTWTVVPSPDTLGSLNAVSCTGPSSCVAIGDGYSEIFNGTSWHAVPLANGGSLLLRAISCTSASSCIAVGFTAAKAGGGALAERWDGQQWTQLTTPDPAGRSFSGVSCSAPDACTAVGVGGPNGTHVTPSLAERWNGTAWTVQATPDLVTTDSPGSNELLSVSCASSTSCIAVGIANQQAVGDGPFGHGYIERWDGSAWTLQSGPADLNLQWLYSVSCVTPSACTAFGGVGFNPSGNGPQLPLALKYNGQSWTQVATPDPTAGQGWPHPGGISCVASGPCLAVGTTEEEISVTNLTPAFSIRDPGSGFVLLDTPSPPSNGAGGTALGSLSCTSPSACTSVDTGGRVIERWDGHAWAVQPTPDDGAVEWGGVSCVSATDCTAVGENNFATPRIEHWDGSAWTIAPSPNPAGAEGSLASVSCTSSSSCLAVGQAENPARTAAAALAERWDGHSWTITAVPNASGPSVWDALQSVSCVSASSCIAVGGDELGTTTLAYAWDGTSWRQLTPAQPGGELTAVACTSASHCLAVGSNAAFSGAIAELWDSSAWTAAAAPPFGTPRAVACFSAARCTAVGFSGTDAVAAAAEWDGSGWTADTPVSPPNLSLLTGVACPTATSCEATGLVNDSTGNEPLAEVSSNPLAQLALTVTRQGRGAGSVSSTPAGIDCGSACAALFDQGTQVTLTETPAAGSTFAGWGGACSGTASTCAVTVNAAASVTATFNASAQPPVVTTLAATGVWHGSAWLNGTVDPRGATLTSCQFDWGTTTQYTSSAPCSRHVGRQAVWAKLTGLVAGTTYHYRLRASTTAGSATGGDLSFTTPSRRGAFTFGNASVSPQASAFQADLARVNPYALGRPGRLRRLSIYLQPTGVRGTQDLRLLLYRDAAGTAGGLVAATRPFAFRSRDPAGWYSFSLRHRRHLAAGRYWIGVLTGATAGVAGWRYADVGVRETRRTAFSDGPTDPFGATDHDLAVMSIYATLRPDRGAGARGRAHTTSVFTPRAPCGRQCDRGGRPG